MRLLKKSLSLLLVLCMVLGYIVPVAPHAHAAEDEMYKIVHLDAGRKYFSMENICDLIDKMADLGYNQLALYLSDNQGFRLMLDDTSFTGLTMNANSTVDADGNQYGNTVSDGNTYDLLDNAIVNSGLVSDDPAFTGYFRPSQEYNQGKKFYLTQAEMTAIITYARAKGIEIAPTINMPGHMGAILMNMPESWRVSHDNKKTVSTMDTTNPTATAFALGLLDKYCKYFKSQGINYVGIGADEYAYDCGAKVANLNSTIKGNVRDFMNKCAAVIKGHEMTPRAFNDFFEAGCGLDKSFEIYYWNGSNVNDVIADGYVNIINTSDSCYYALGSQWYTEAQTVSGTAAFVPNVVSTYGGTSSTLTVDPVGAAYAIWCDRGYYDDATSADAGSSVINNATVNTGLEQFIDGIKKYESGNSDTIYMEVGETTTLGNASWNVAEADLTVTSSNTTAATVAKRVISEGSDGAAGGGLLTALPEDSTAAFVIKSGDNYMTYGGTGETFGVTTSAEEATEWTHVGDGVVLAKTAKLNGAHPCYLIYNGDIVKAYHDVYRNWNYSNTGFVDRTSNTYLYYDGGWKVSSSAPANPALAYAAGAAATTPVTGVTVTANAVGESTITIIANGVTSTYTIIVEGAAPVVAHPTIDVANCNHKPGMKVPSSAAQAVSQASSMTASQALSMAAVEGEEYFCITCGTVFTYSAAAAEDTLETGPYSITLAPGETYVWDSTGKTFTFGTEDQTGNFDTGSKLGGSFAVDVTAKTVTFTAAESATGTGSVSLGGQTFNITIQAASDVDADATMAVGGTATVTLEGQYGTDGATGTTANGMASYSVKITSVTTGGDSSSDPAPWDSGTAYTGGEQCTYNGKIWEANWWTQGNTPGSGGEWKEIGPASSGGTTTYTTTITFTGVKAGTDTLTIGDKTLTVVVTSEACAHANTTTTYTKVDDTNHQVTVTCDACGEVISTTNAAHTGGTANCVDKATCTTCNQTYGNVNTSVHKGPEELRNASATYTGDKYCSACDTLLEEGNTITPDPDAMAVTVEVGKTATVTLDGQVGTNGTTGKTVNGKASYTVAITSTTGGEAYPAWNNDNGAGYNKGDKVTYNGKNYEYIYDSATYYSSLTPDEDTEKWKEIGAAGSGTATTTTTITFTGISAGTDTVTIGTQVFNVTVTSQACAHSATTKTYTDLEDGVNHTVTEVCNACGTTVSSATQPHVEVVVGKTDTYTGDVYCDLCDALIRKGQDITVEPEAHSVTVVVNQSAPVVLNGQVGTNGATGSTTNGLANYSVAITAPSTEAAEWDSTASTQYTVGDRVTYGGKIYECIADCWWSNPPSEDTTYWREVTSSGETTTYTTTITFTGVTAGTDTVTIGGEVFNVTVIADDTECPHTNEVTTCTPSGSLVTHTETITCKDCGTVLSSTNDPHQEVLIGYVANTQTTPGYSGDLVCKLCNMVLEEGHVLPAGNHVHTGGTATCKTLAVCDACGESYGELDPTSHMGPIVSGSGFSGATTTAAGHAGGETCMACGASTGGTSVVLPMFLEENWYDIVVNAGGTYTVTQEGALGTILNNGVDSTTAAANVTFSFAEGKDITGPTAATELTSLPVNTPFIIRSGDTYLKAIDNQEALQTTASDADATQWLFDGTYIYAVDVKMNGVSMYLIDGWIGAAQGLKGFAGEYGPAWSFKADGLYNGTKKLTLDGTAFALTTDASAAKSYPMSPASNGSPAMDSVLTITVTGVDGSNAVAGNGGTVTANGINYRITVLPAAPAVETLPIRLFQTNYQGYRYYETSPMTGTDFTLRSDMYGWDEHDEKYHYVASEEGIALDEVGTILGDDGEIIRDLTNEYVFPYYVKTWHVDTSTAHLAGYSHSRLLPSGVSQTPYEGSAVQDVADAGVEWFYVRYWNGQWQFAGEDRVFTSTWDGSQEVIAYYLQETDVTNETILSTYVKDWGEASALWSGQWVAIDFAVQFEGGDRIPGNDGFPIDQKTSYFHVHDDWDWYYPNTGMNIPEDGIVYTENNQVFRKVRTIEGIETGEYEVYMITLKYSEENPGTISTVASCNYDTTDSEYVVWLQNQDTVIPDGYNLITPEDAGYMTKYPNPDGSIYQLQYGEYDGQTYNFQIPTVDYVNIPNQQGALLTYWVRFKETSTADAVQVHYRLDDGTTVEGSIIPGSVIYDYAIPVEAGSFFNPGFDDGETPTGLVNNTITNIGGATETITSVLKNLPNTPAQYRTGSFDFNGHIEFILDDGSIVNQEDYTGGNIKEVVLYYSVDNIHYVPVDFGHRLAITPEFFQHHVNTTDFDISYVFYGYASAGQTGAGGGSHETPYAVIRTDSSISDGFIYQLLKMLDGKDTIPVTVALTDKGTRAVSYEQHYITFIPATTVYYEEFFAVHYAGTNYSSGWVPYYGGVRGQTNGFLTDLQQAYCYTDSLHNSYNYGRDDGINRNVNAPSGSSEVVAMSSNDYTEFSFNGTGIEIYANCTPNSSNAVVFLYKGSGDTKTLKSLFLVDTRTTKDENATDATNFLPENTYNIPIVTLTDMDYGTYTVRIGYMKSNDEAERTDGFRFDGYRIFDPMPVSTYLGTDGEKAVSASTIYGHDAELNPDYFDLRDALMAQVTLPSGYEGDYYDQLGDDIAHQVMSGSADVKAVIVDTNGTDLSLDDDAKVELLDKGAKNEIYLKPGQALMFHVNSQSAIQVGMKSLAGSAKVQFTVSDGTGYKFDTIDVKTTTNMFYPAVQLYDAAGSGLASSEVVVVKNTSTDGSILAITMLKLIKNDLDNAAVLLPVNDDFFGIALMALSLELPDDESMEAAKPNQPASAEEYYPEKVYLVGSVVTYGGKTYRAKWWTKGEKPGTAEVWELIPDLSETDNGIPAWDANTVYNAGDKVTYNGCVYEAKWWTKGEKPGEAEWGAWKLVE